MKGDVCAEGRFLKGYTKGMYLIKVAGHSDALLDFGNGECDNAVTLLINGKSKQITMEQ